MEFRYPRQSNSGVYLRGRYEIQIEDSHGEEPDSHRIGGVYGFLTPSVNAAKEPGEWQTLEAVLVGRTVTVVLNGERIIDRQAIPGITGGALDSDEGSPGPIMLQGDHGQVEFRKLTLTPGVSERQSKKQLSTFLISPLVLAAFTSRARASRAILRRARRARTHRVHQWPAALLRPSSMKPLRAAKTSPLQRRPPRVLNLPR